MSDADQPDFSAWRPLIDAARAVAENYEEPYRTVVFETLLKTGQPRQDVSAPPQAESRIEGPETVVAEEAEGLAGAAQEAGVPVEALRRIVEIHESDEDLELLVQIGGDTRSEKANHATAVYLFLREQLFGHLEVDSEDVRELCKQQGAYDSANFTKNFRNNDLILERGKRGSPKKRYRLSQQGVEAAKEILRDVLDTGGD